MTNGPSKLLIVDDERLHIRMLSDLLQERFQVKVAMNGRQAIERALSDPQPDLIILDIHMPDMDGFQVLAALKAEPRTREIPVIFLTAMDAEEDEARGLALGAVDYIRKPISPSIVLARTRTHLALKQSLEAQKELNRVKNRFLGIAAHDLRNPLISIRGMSELMVMMPLPEEKKAKFIQTIHKVSNQMLQLVDDLLDVSVIESGRFDLRLEQCNLSGLAAERAELVADRAESKGIRLVAELAGVADTLLDADRVGQVIDNLLTNAIKFSESGTTILLVVREAGSRVEVLVTDQGPGIPEDEVGNLFGVFKKLSIQPTGDERSTGLGLSIVKKIVEAHNGGIRVDSEVGKGTTFTVGFPVQVERR